jgi:hypothetical protein
MKRHDNYINRMRREARECGEQLRENIRHSKHGKWKIAGLEAIPLVMGATLGGIGRITGTDWIPAVPILMDFMTNAEGYITKRGMIGLLKYGVGVALPYADKIYLMVNQIIDNS